MQSSGLTASTGWCPLALILSLLSAKTFLGHTSTQRPQPLHLSVKNDNFAI
jgi:hypothetical protein